MSLAHHQPKYERAEAIIGYRPQKFEKGYLWEALQVAGSGQNRIGGRLVYDGNKRLAILGDTAMALAIAGPWYERDDTLASTKLAANLIEAVVGAVWLDSDESIAAVRQVMEALGFFAMVIFISFPHI
ncbi:unnamed protein product [Aureobasidium uvarum]|uniref:RNase III domain-containing protein n=1 Tax=Aureobasidium uvarum TaxID=2773716 RepID=A0A9N8PW20_9PEZI|nr:unnamed protein product [Aureobasidium uvarum]